MNNKNYKVVMTPILQGNVKTIKVERVYSVDIKNVYLEATGKNSGLVINKEDKNSKDDKVLQEMQLEFTCMMRHEITGDTYAENRRIKFWFIEGLKQLEKLDVSYEFFKELINPAAFPKDYPMFVKKVMVQLQMERFSKLRRVDIDFITLNKQEQDALVPRLEEKPIEIIVKENLQARLDEAYPNCLGIDDLIRILGTKDNILKPQIEELLAKDVIEIVTVEGKMMGYRRKICYYNEDVKVVKETDQMQKIFKKEKPTVAIITNLLCEKLAVDAMMNEKTTFVKFEGESHVYTIGRIGDKKVISTKVAMVGRELKARISSANTTTRLLGTFQDVQHVLIVGVGGSVPHMYEFDKHSRLGDIVVSYPNEDSSVYIFCEKLHKSEESFDPNTVAFEIKDFRIKENALPKVIDEVLENFVSEPKSCEWFKYMNEAKSELEMSDIKYSRPSSDTDKLKLKVSEKVVFDMKHPEVPKELEHLYLPNQPAVRLGSIGSGRPVTDDDLLRDRFSKEHCLLAYDSEYDQVLDSIKGNGLGSFALIRGIADYIDGSTGGIWQPYASLAAAAFMKAIILRLKIKG